MRLLALFGDAVDCLSTPRVHLLAVSDDTVDCLSTQCVRVLAVFGDAVDCLSTPCVRLLAVFGNTVDCLSTQCVPLLAGFVDSSTPCCRLACGPLPTAETRRALDLWTRRLPAVNLLVTRSLPGKQDEPRICRLVDSLLSTRLWAAPYRWNKTSLQICRLIDSPVGPAKSQPGRQVCSCRPASSRLEK